MHSEGFGNAKMEMIEGIHAGRALLGLASNSTTARARELLRPTATTDDPTTDQYSEVITAYSCARFLGGYGEISKAVTARANWISEQNIGSGGAVGVLEFSPVAFTLGQADNIEKAEYQKWLNACKYVDLGGVVNLVSPFEHIGIHRNVHLAVLVESIGAIYRVPYAKQLKDRLVSLCEAWNEEHEASESPSAESLSGLLRFLSSARDVKLPSIVLSPHGNWVAEWRLDAQNLFSAHFLDEVNARFVAVVAKSFFSLRPPNQVWGEIEIGKLIPTAKAYGADRWVCA